MIKVTVELISAVSSSRNKILGVGYISNNVEKTYETNGYYGDYKVELSKSGKKINETWRNGKVENFPRKRLLAWDLVTRALVNTVGLRK